MKSLINEQLCRAYADQDFLTRQKASALAWICLLSLPVACGIFVQDLCGGSASLRFYIFSLSPMIAVLALALYLILKGRFQRWIHTLFAAAVLVHVVDGALLVQAGLLRTFFLGYASYGYALLLSAAIFVRRPLFHAIAAAEILSLPLFGYLLVPEPAWATFDQLYRSNLFDGAFSRLLVWGIAWAFVVVVDRSMQRVQQELDTNRRLRESLETMVEERTRELVAARHEAEGANRAKGAFLANVSHEIRTPIHGILGMTDLLLEEETDEAKIERLRIVSDSGSHLLGIIQDILDYSRIEAGGMELHPQPLRLETFLRSLIDPLEVLARGKGDALVLTLADDLPQHVRADGLRLRQILTNLLANAIKFTANGTVELSVERDAASDRFLLKVRDTGIGMGPQVLERIFDRFRQADESIVHRYGGTGLGLSISRMLTVAMEGTIEVDSRQGEGSCFTVRLPLEPCAAPMTDSELADSLFAESGQIPDGLRILLVDDNEINRKIADAVLTKLGCLVEHADNGRAALDLLGSHPFDLAVMDCNLPELDGFAVTRALRAWRGGGTPSQQVAADLPVVALTASAMEEVREDCLSAGMDEVLIKPFHPRDLRLAVAHWCGRSRTA